MAKAGIIFVLSLFIPAILWFYTTLQIRPMTQDREGLLIERIQSIN